MRDLVVVIALGVVFLLWLQEFLVASESGCHYVILGFLCSYWRPR